jgi:hypothetical protein
LVEDEAKGQFGLISRVILYRVGCYVYSDVVFDLLEGEMRTPPCDGVVDVGSIIVLSDELFEEVGPSDDELDSAMLEPVRLEVEEGLAGGLPALVETGRHAVLSIGRLTTEGESCSARSRLPESKSPEK